MRRINKVFLVVICFIGCLNLMGYDLSIPVSAAITPDSQYSNNLVYLQTDRNYYLPGESIMFKAFILNDSNSKSNPVNDTLHVFLLDQEGINVAAGTFPVNNTVPVEKNCFIHYSIMKYFVNKFFEKISRGTAQVPKSF